MALLDQAFVRRVVVLPLANIVRLEPGSHPTFCAFHRIFLLTPTGYSFVEEGARMFSVYISTSSGENALRFTGLVRLLAMKRTKAWHGILAVGMLGAHIYGNSVRCGMLRLHTFYASSR